MTTTSPLLRVFQNVQSQKPYSHMTPQRLVPLGLAIVVLFLFLFWPKTPTSPYLQWTALKLSNNDPFDQWYASLPVGEAAAAGAEMWGRHELQGWVASPALGLADLGQEAEDRWKLDILPGEEGVVQYFDRLVQFANGLPSAMHAALLQSLESHLPPRLRKNPPYLPTRRHEQHGRPDRSQPPQMVAYKTIHMTDATPLAADSTRNMDLWLRMNAADGWRVEFSDDSDSYRWMKDHWAGSDVEWTWEFMHRPVLRADLWRYLKILHTGGVYTDIDTQPIRPVEHWGQNHVEYLDISLTDGPDWMDHLSSHPALIVGFESDVHRDKKWGRSIPRALGVAQWTFAAAPNHPILLDAVRRVVEATKIVEEWEKWRIAETERLQLLRKPGWKDKVRELSGMQREDKVSVMQWTGPGMWSDSVMAYLQTRYNVTWHRLRGLNHPLRIGDVLVLPITAFHPSGWKDWKSEGLYSPQAAAHHLLRGSWRVKGGPKENN